LEEVSPQGFLACHPRRKARIAIWRSLPREQSKFDPEAFDIEAVNEELATVR